MKALLFLSLSMFHRNLLLTNASSDGFELELVQVLFRHGDRTPNGIERYETDPYDPVGYQKYGYGQLSATGKRRAYKLGQMLRKHYDDFLGDYNVHDVYGYSTDYDRAKMSLQLVLSGLYPPTEETRWSKEIDWIPIPIHYEPFETNFLQYDFLGICSERFMKLLDEAEQSHEISEIMKNNRDIFEYIKNETHITSTRVTQLALIASNLECVLSLGLPLPDWCSNLVYEKLQEVFALFYDLESYTPLMIKIAFGPIIDRLLENIYNAEKGETKKKIYLHSAHDLQIGQFIRAHDFTNIPERPKFGSAVIVEKLRGKDDDHTYIRILYWAGVTDKLTALKLEKCNYNCLLADYVDIISPFLPDPGYTKCER